MATPVEAKQKYTRTISKPEVVDGDTIKGFIGCSDKLVCGQWYFRVSGIDAPEYDKLNKEKANRCKKAKNQTQYNQCMMGAYQIKSECNYEHKLGIRAKKHAESLMIDGALVKGTNLYRKGCPYGRICGDISIGGVDIAKSLLNSGLAVRTSGKRHEWCDGSTPAKTKYKKAP